MMRSGRLRKGLIFLLLAALAGLALIGCARLYLTSRRASRQIADKLEAILGAPVQIREVDVGINSGSSLSGLQVFEANGQRPEQPWLTVADVRVDLSALNVVGGDMSPQRVALSGAAIDLRFDEDGRLITSLPKIKPTGRPFPQLVLEGGRLTLDQAGRPPMVIQGLSAEADDRDGDLAFHGTIHDDYWGDWTAEGSFSAAKGAIALRLKTPYTKITQEKLDRLPFVSPATWRQVQLDGYSPVDFEVHFTVGDKGVHYRVELAPENTEVTVTSIQLHASQASGKVTVEDRVVHLRDVRGRNPIGVPIWEMVGFGGGSVLCTALVSASDARIVLPQADLDFRTPVYDLSFKDISVTKVELRKLPASWHIPTTPLISGPMTLTGKASLQVDIRNGKALTTGDGSGAVDAVVFKQAKMIDVHLKADEKG